MTGERIHFSSEAPPSGEERGHHHRAKKSMGQNFLVDDNIARKIVRSAGIAEGDTVVEIGPGSGSLTRFLVSTGADIVAIEKDNSLFRLLGEKFSGAGSLSLIHGDFMDFAFPERSPRVKVLGNIPYNMTSRMVSKIVDDREHIDSAVLMVQEEVAGRLAASAGSKDYGAISVRLNLVADVTRLFAVGPSCFRPRPKVDSRVIKITIRVRERIEREDEFVAFVKRAFGMRRKMLRHFAAHYYGKDSVDLLEEKYRTGRIETMTPEEIYRLFSILERNARSN